VAPTVAGVFLSFGALLIFRINTYSFVLRDGTVVSGLNDPYYFRDWMEQLLAAADGPTDLSILSETSGQAFDGVRPATHALNWWLAELTGPDFVAAWLPVASSLAVGVLLFGIAYRLTRDIRVGFTTVGMFAFIPLHAVYSGIGFLDHQVHQYFWLAVLLTGLVLLAGPLRATHTDDSAPVSEYLTTPRTWGIATLTGIAVGVSVHIWNGSALVISPLFVYIVLRVPTDVRAGLSPVRALLPVVTATAVGASFALGLHLLLNWGQLYIALTPAYVVSVSTVIICVGEIWRRFSLPPVTLIPIEGITAAVGAWIVARTTPDTVAEYNQSLEFVLNNENIAEVVSLFDPNILIGPFLRLGVTFFIAIPALLWITISVAWSYKPGWLSIVVYTWVFLAAATIQNRFAGQLSVVIAVFAGLGFAVLLGRLGIIRPVTEFPGPGPIATLSQAITTHAETDEGDDPESDETGTEGPPASPDRTQDRGSITRLGSPTTRRAYLALGSSLAVTGVVSAALVDAQTRETSYSDAEYRAAQAIATHQEIVSREYPANFVLSRWGSNRMYNYFVNGESKGYDFARNTYPDFLTEQSPDEWAENNRDRVGYVVIEAEDADLPPGTAYHMLQERLGVAMEYRNPLSHYRLLSLAGDGDSPDDWTLSAFAIVPGATITGTGTPGETVTAGTEVSVSGVTFPYQQAAAVNDEGEFALTVSYPGEYSLKGTQVQISESAIITGQSFSVD
jgi:dolichyl-diphosphooligosaccharide--protein glycosyltransferase